MAVLRYNVYPTPSAADLRRIREAAIAREGLRYGQAGPATYGGCGCRFWSFDRSQTRLCERCDPPRRPQSPQRNPAADAAEEAALARSLAECRAAVASPPSGRKGTCGDRADRRAGGA